jgi:CDP-paratose 2-epimerase
MPGVPETLSIDLCEHTPYGVSKLAGDLYVQDYAKLYGMKTGVFRMSCIYGTGQFGNEDQGWVAHFVISTVTGKPLTIYGDGKQVRDVLYATDLVRAYDLFLESNIKDAVYNMGGGPENTISLLELLDTLEDATGKRSSISYSDWRPSDQKVYISDISKAKKELGWEPKIATGEGIRKLITWIEENKGLFQLP